MQHTKYANFSLAALAVLTFSGAAMAHTPIAECTQFADQTIECRGGFSDGSKAAGVTLEVIGYDEKVLIMDKLDKDAKLRFKRPDVDFYVILDAGPGHVVEVDQSEIKKAS